MLSSLRRLMLLAVVPVMIAAGATWYSRGSLHATTLEPVPGMVRTTEIHVAPEISGHLARFLVEPGSTVQRGQAVALLDNPELWAAVGVARAQIDRAR
jgi:multidrug resistance efflux pump